MTDLNHHITKWLGGGAHAGFFDTEAIPFVEESFELDETSGVQYRTWTASNTSDPPPWEREERRGPRVVPPTHAEQPGVKDHSVIKSILRRSGWL